VYESKSIFAVVADVAPKDAAIYSQGMEITPMIPANATQAELEQLYSLLLSTVVVLARLLGKPCPVVTRSDRRQERQKGVNC